MAGIDPIWQCATVRRERDGRKWLQFEDRLACARCARGTGCGAALFSRMFGHPRSRLPLPSDCEIPPGIRVRVGVSASWLLFAAAVAYLAPVCGFVFGAIAADWFHPGDDVLALSFGLGSLVLTVAALGSGARGLLKPKLVIADRGEALETEHSGKHLDPQ